MTSCLLCPTTSWGWAAPSKRKGGLAMSRRRGWRRPAASISHSRCRGWLATAAPPSCHSRTCHVTARPITLIHMTTAARNTHTRRAIQIGGLQLLTSQAVLAGDDSVEAHTGHGGRATARRRRVVPGYTRATLSARCERCELSRPTGLRPGGGLAEPVAARWARRAGHPASKHPTRQPAAATQARPLAAADDAPARRPGDSPPLRRPIAPVPLTLLSVWCSPSPLAAPRGVKRCWAAGGARWMHLCLARRRRPSVIVHLYICVPRRGASQPSQRERAPGPLLFSPASVRRGLQQDCKS